MFFVPGENGIDPALFDRRERAPDVPGSKLRLVFVGRLIPLKACYLAFRRRELLRTGAATFTVVGDGPERSRLENLTKSLAIDDCVTFTGWLTSQETLRKFQQADVLVFPSLREFGGAVIFEALALGAVPVVADFGGPGDIVTPQVGYRIALVDETDLVTRLEVILNCLAADRTHLKNLRQNGMKYAGEQLTGTARRGQ